MATSKPPFAGLLRGTAKNTANRLLHVDEHGRGAVMSKNNLLTTIAWGIDGRVEYA